MEEDRLKREFYIRDVLILAPDLLGKKIVRIIKDKRFEYYITEVEAYRGTEDLACHASKGRTRRTEAMYLDGGHVYMYFIYGMYWMFNIVASEAGTPQAVLIRSLKGINGPGRLSRELQLDKGLYGEYLVTSNRLWIENGREVNKIKTSPRIAVDFAGDYWEKMEWRFFVEDEQLDLL
jgi:DNA-3-methyladenine glycosylase